MVTSTLTLLALLGSDDLLGLMPEQIVSHPLGPRPMRCCRITRKLKLPPKRKQLIFG